MSNWDEAVAAQRAKSETINRVVVVDRIAVCEWPKQVADGEELATAIHLLGAAYVKYQTEAQFNRFDENDVDLLRRLARAIVTGYKVDPVVLVDRYILLFGRPEQIR